MSSSITPNEMNHHVEEFQRFYALCVACSCAFPLMLSLYYQHIQKTSSQNRFSGIISLLVVHPLVFSSVRCMTHIICNIPYGNFYDNKPSDFVMILPGILFQDFLFYWIHRAMHKNQWLYDTIHREHHKDHEPEVWSTFRASIGEIILCNACTMIIPGVVFNFGYMAFGVFQTLLLSQAIRGHTRDSHVTGGTDPHVNYTSTKLSSYIMTRNFHANHHMCGRGNYGGFHFIFWDQLMGTHLTS